MHRLAVWVSAAALVVLGLGAPLLLLQSRPWVAWLSGIHSQTQAAGITQAQGLQLAEQVRRFVTTGAGELPSTFDGRPAFDASAVSHLADVARVLRAAGTLVWLLLAAAAAGVVIALRRGRLQPLGEAMVLAGYFLVAGVLAVGIIGMVDFDLFFSAFHGLFFQAGTWTFPYDSLLIRLFPEPFWVSMGVALGGMALALGVFYLLVGARLRGRHA